MKDKELDQLLTKLRATQPSDLLMHKWKKAVYKESVKKKINPNFLWLKLMAASLAGFIVGGFVFGSRSPSIQDHEFAKNTNEDATIEYVLIKTN